MSKPICRDCVAVVQPFKLCRNLSAGTVLQGCSSLNGVQTYLPALCCRGATVKALSKPICRHCVAVVQLFKWCRNISAGHCAAGVQLFKQCCNLSAGTVLQGCSCKVLSKLTCWHCAAGVQLFKWCQNLFAGTMLQRCSCLSGVETFLPAMCCRGAAV